MNDNVYLYIFQIPQIDNNFYSKIGISKTPEKRAAACTNDFGMPIYFYKKYFIGCRDKAKEMERVVKNNFAPIIGQEIFNIHPKELDNFVKQMGVI